MKAGDWVHLNVEPGCEGEWLAHGIAPRLRGKLGRITIIAEGRGPNKVPDHYYWVYIPDLRSHSWFTKQELILAEGRTP